MNTVYHKQREAKAKQLQNRDEEQFKLISELSSGR